MSADDINHPRKTLLEGKYFTLSSVMFSAPAEYNMVKKKSDCKTTNQINTTLGTAHMTLSTAHTQYGVEAFIIMSSYWSKQDTGQGRIEQRRDRTQPEFTSRTQKP